MTIALPMIPQGCHERSHCNASRRATTVSEWLNQSAVPLLTGAARSGLPNDDMLERETILPLTLGAIIALALHVVLLPAMAHSLRDQEELPKWPDLRLESLELSQRMIAGREAHFDFVISNQGLAATPMKQGVITRFVLSEDDALDANDVLLFEHSLLVGVTGIALDAKQSSEKQTAKIILPRDASRFRQLIVVIDPQDTIKEAAGEKNNVTAQPIRIYSQEEIAKPDLVMLAASSPAAVRTGEVVPVEFAVGGATDSEPVIASWFDGVFLSTNETLDTEDMLLTATPGPSAILTAGFAYSRRAEVRIELPSHLKGDRFFLIFVADHLARIDELDETNNTIARPIRVLRPDAAEQPEKINETARGAADLHVPVFSAPDTVMNGETLTLDAIIANRGDGATKATNWRDRVYLSKDNVLDEGDKLLATHEQSQPLAAGGYYTSRLTGLIDLPEEESGARFLIIKTDADDALEESDETNNVRIRPIQVEQLVLGKDKPDDVRTAVAWIPYDDFRKLIAVASSVEQPALQSKVDPVKNASTPRDPSPPSPPQPQPVEVVKAKKTPEPTDPTKASKQREPTEQPEDPSKRIEAKSPLTTPAVTSVEQSEAKALAMLPVAPKAQPRAEGPAATGNPVRQPMAQADRPATGAPSTQTEIALPTPLAPVIDPDATFVKPDARSNESRESSKSDVTTASKNPAQQPRAETPVPIPGAPARLLPSDAPPSEKGQPTTLIPSKTPEPMKDGQPTTSPPQEGKEQPTPKPATSADESAKETPKADDEKATKPVPPTQPSNPTSAPRDESDVPPTILEDRQFAVEPGGVITRPGIQIVASTPDITTPSWLVSGPTAANPIVRITFDREGNVKKIDMIRTTGHANLDSPIKASFFNFRAKGEALKRVRDTFTIEIKLLLKNERE